MDTSELSFLIAVASASANSSVVVESDSGKPRVIKPSEVTSVTNGNIAYDGAN